MEVRSLSQYVLKCKIQFSKIYKVNNIIKFVWYI